MAIRSVGFALAVMLLLLVVVGAQNTDLVSAVCNNEVIPAGSPFYGTLANLVSDLELNIAISNGYDYKASTAGSPSAYGEAICGQLLSDVECTNCLYALGDNILNICSNAIGAQVQFTDCSIRYEQYDF